MFVVFNNVVLCVFQTASDNIVNSAVAYDNKFNVFEQYKRLVVSTVNLV